MMELALGFRFAVTFFVGGATPNPIDIHFQRVSGLESEIKTVTVVEGGQNLYSHRLPERIDHGNLVLERGVLAGASARLPSPLRDELDVAMTAFRLAPSNVLVTLLDADGEPIRSWSFIKAFPVRWSISDLDANEEKVVVESMELAYAHMQRIRI